MHIVEFYGIDANLNLCYDRKPHTIEVIYDINSFSEAEESERMFIEPDELEDFVREHPKYSGYWERCVNLEDDWSEGELDDFGFVQGSKRRIKVLDWDAFMQELDNAIIVEFIKSALL